MNTTRSKEVTSYIEMADPRAEPILMELRELIVSAVPNAEEVMSWNAPFYKYHGYLAGFAAYTQHVRVGIVGDEISPEDRKVFEELGYTTLERAIQIKFDQKVPTEALKRVFQTKAKMNEAKVH